MSASDAPRSRRRDRRRWWCWSRPRCRWSGPRSTWTRRRQSTFSIKVNLLGQVRRLEGRVEPATLHSFLFKMLSSYKSKAKPHPFPLQLSQNKSSQNMIESKNAYFGISLKLQLLNILTLGCDTIIIFWSNNDIKWWRFSSNYLFLLLLWESIF